MRTLITFLVLSSFLSCKEKEPINHSVSHGDSVMLLGKANKDGLTQAPFNEWFVPEYEAYRVNDSLTSLIKPLIKDVDITIFMGTWCSDSQRETPHFYKILEQMDFDMAHLTLITVDDTKTTPHGYETNLDITNVPTFIFFKDGTELNRIVEYPITSLEQDMFDILTDNGYKHAYAY